LSGVQLKDRDAVNQLIKCLPNPLQGLLIMTGCKDFASLYVLRSGTRDNDRRRTFLPFLFSKMYSGTRTHPRKKAQQGKGCMNSSKFFIFSRTLKEKSFLPTMLMLNVLSIRLTHQIRMVGNNKCHGLLQTCELCHPHVNLTEERPCNPKELIILRCRKHSNLHLDGCSECNQISSGESKAVAS